MNEKLYKVECRLDKNQVNLLINHDAINKEMRIVLTK